MNLTTYRISAALSVTGAVAAILAVLLWGPPGGLVVVLLSVPVFWLIARLWSRREAEAGGRR